MIARELDQPPPRMKTITLLLATVLGTGLAAPARSAPAGAPFELHASVVAGGGTTSTNREAGPNGRPRFVLQATLGQAEAAPMLQSPTGRFALEPGFWHGITVVQSPGAPLLSIHRGRNGTVILSWPIASTGFWLEETPAPGTSPWTRTDAPVVDTATEHTVRVPANGGIKCYRLRAETGSH